MHVRPALVSEQRLTLVPEVVSMHFEASNQYKNTDRNIESRSSELSRNLHQDFASAKLPALHAATDSAVQYLPKFEIQLGDLSHNDYKHESKGELARDTKNAREQLPFLMDKLKKLDPQTKGQDGLTREDLERLESMRDLTKQERDAIRFLKENYDALSTTRRVDAGGQLGWVSWQQKERRITPFSFDRNAGDAKPTGTAEYSVERKAPAPNEQEVGNEGRLIPGDNQKGERKELQPTRRPN